MDDAIASASPAPPAAGPVLGKASARPAIGRFEVVSVLRRSPRAVVYLAQDPVLERRVAIKAIPAAADVDGDHTLAQARGATRVRHPHLIPAFEAGRHGGHPYLVSEYVEGETLAARIARAGALAPGAAVRLIGQILDALGAAHDQGLAHGEVKPANVMIATGERALLMDLGIAHRTHDRRTGRLWTGDPAWMAPEQARAARPLAASDLYACGLLLACAMTGRSAFDESDPAGALAAAAEGLAAPPALPEAAGDALATVLRKALDRDPQRRFESAAVMRAALHAALPASEREPAPADTEATSLEFLLERMRQRTDFPALSAAISAVTQALADDTERLSRLTDTILLDFALTHRVLRLVNSAGFAGSGAGRISTISSAVQILGFDQVRNVAVSLMLFEHMGHKAHAETLREMFIEALFAGVLARAQSPRCGARDAEEAFVCTLFRELGRMLAVHYFPEEWSEIRARIAARRIDETAAATQVLGASLRDLGVATAHRWGLPDRIVHSMLPVAESALRRPANEDDRLRLVAAFATELARAAGQPPAARTSGLAEAARRFRQPLSLDGEDGAIEPFVRECVVHLATCAAAYGLDIAQTAYGRALLSLTASGADALSVVAALPSDAEAIAPGETLPPGTSLPPTPGPAPGATVPPPIVAAADQALLRLREGLRAAQASLFAGRGREAVIAEVLAAVQTAPGIERALYAECDAWGNRIVGRQGAGPGADALLPYFRSESEGRPDVFFAALARNADVLISDAADPRIAARIPLWYRERIGAGAFLVLPLVVDGEPRGLIYADALRGSSIVLPPPALRLLRALRDLAASACARG